MKKQTAVLETSFWSVGYIARIDEYLPLYFELFVPPEVEEEILGRDSRRPKVIFPYSQLYEIVKDAGHISVCKPSTRIGMFGKGEEPAICLARDKGCSLLINDAKPYHFAKAAFNLQCFTVPGFVAFLASQGRITIPAAKAKLREIQPNTAAELIQEVNDILDRLGMSQGGTKNAGHDNEIASSFPERSKRDQKNQPSRVNS